jgi:acetyl esterase/lipase
VRFSIKAIQGPRLDSGVFKPGSVPAATLAVTERLRQQGTTGPELSTARIEELKSLASERRRAGGRAAVRLCGGARDRRPAGPLGLRVLSSGKVRACYLHVHGGGWALGGPDRHDQTLLRFASAARVALIAVDYRLTPEHPHPAGPASRRSAGLPPMGSASLARGD